jgi:hypothetical protein
LFREMGRRRFLHGVGEFSETLAREAQRLLRCQSTMNREDPAGTRRFETALFLVLLGLHLLLIWVFPFTPTQDGPDHQALTHILREYDEPGAGLLRQYYQLNEEALPNWFIFFVMGQVLGFVPVPVAEKILLTAYVLLLPLSVRYALRAIDPRAGFLAVLAFPFLFSFFFHMGFFNFCFSLTAFFFAVGYWLKHAEEMGIGRTAVLALLVLWVYFCHPSTLVVTVTVLLTLAGWRALLDLPPLWQAVRRWLLVPLIACLPALVLMASFVRSRADSPVVMMPLWRKAGSLATLHSLASLTIWTIPVTIALAVLFYVVAALCLKERRGQGRRLQVGDGLLLTVAGLTLAFFIAPDEISSGGFINDRLLLFPFLTAILWFGTRGHPARRRLGVQVAAAGIALAFLGLFAWKYAEINRSLAGIAAAGELVEPDHTFLYLSYAHQGEDGKDKLSFRTWPFVHAGGYVGARKRLADLSLYQAHADFFPLYFRPAMNPYRNLSTPEGSIESAPPVVDLLGYPKRTGGRVDYVLLWGLRDEQRSEPKVRRVLDQLAAGYDLVHSAQEGRVRLYRARSHGIE